MATSTQPEGEVTKALAELKKVDLPAVPAGYKAADKAADAQTLAYMQNIAFFNTKPGEIRAITSTTGNPFDSEMSAQKPFALWVNGSNGILSGPPATGVAGNGGPVLGQTAVIFSATDLTPTQSNKLISASTLASSGVKYAAMQYVSENQVNINVPDAPAGMKMIDAFSGTVYIHLARQESTGAYTVFPGTTRTMSTVSQFDLFPLQGADTGKPSGTEAINDLTPFAKPVMRDLLPLRATHADGRPVLPSDPAGPGETITMYAAGLSAGDQTRLRILAAPGAKDTYVSGNVFDVTETSKGSGVYTVTFQVPDATTLTKSALLLPDARGIEGSETYDPTYSDRARKNWNPNRPDASTPSTGTGLVFSFAKQTSPATAGTISDSDTFYLPTSTGTAR